MILRLTLLALLHLTTASLAAILIVGIKHAIRKPGSFLELEGSSPLELVIIQTGETSLTPVFPHTAYIPFPRHIWDKDV